MQAATHPSGPAAFPHSAYPSEEHRQHPMSSAPQQALQPSAASGGDPAPFNGRRGDYEFSLVIDQQPIRARMCGFGDKDRRPITPPPCVRVIVKDMRTGKEVPAEEINATFFLLTVDLWDDVASVEKNIVRSSGNSPAVSISTATTTSFPVPPERPVFSAAPQGVPMYAPQYGGQVPGAPYAQSQPGAPYAPGQPGAVYQPQAPAHPGMYQGQPQAGGYYQGHPYPQQYPGQPMPQQGYAQAPGYPPQGQQTSSSGMFTRNLIGSLAVNSFTLHDLNKEIGHWFVLQDLSVRTEGTFRLKMSFIDVGTHESPLKTSENKLTQGKTAVLASVFSQPFTVFSAKKFPGVIESTALSKCFAQQGIKIPIRKDGVRDGGGKDDDGDD